jgi:hypothetical protein
VNKTSERLCAYGGVAFCAFLGAGIWFVAGGLAPPSPALTAQQIDQIFAQNAGNIRIGAALLAFGSMFFWPFAAAIASQMKRIEGTYHPLADTQMGTASGTVIAALLAAFIWMALTFRPGAIAAPGGQTMNDLAWLVLIAAYPPATIQCVAMGVCMLSRRNEGVYPRWLGFANLWCAVVFVAGVLVPFFQTGPFAWDGLVAYWLVAGVFFVWILGMVWATARAVATAE